jgi:hypothetical protein
MVARPAVHRSAVTYVAVLNGAAWDADADGDHDTAAVLRDVAARYAAIAAAAPNPAA